MSARSLFFGVRDRSPRAPTIRTVYKCCLSSDSATWDGTSIRPRVVSWRRVARHQEVCACDEYALILAIASTRFRMYAHTHTHIRTGAYIHGALASSSRRTSLSPSLGRWRWYDDDGGWGSPSARQAVKRPLLLRLNLFNLPNPLRADSARRREYSPLSALDDSNSCVTSGNQPREHDHEFPGGRFRYTPRGNGWYFWGRELA